MPLLFCQPEDIRARTDTSLEDDPLLDLIEGVSDQIEEYVGAWLAPRPSDPDATTTFLFDVETSGAALRLMSGNRRVGIRSLTALSTATTGQPDTSGEYSAITLSNVVLRPRPTADAPASTLLLTTGQFYRGYNTVQATGSFGPAAIAPRVREVAIELAIAALSNTNLGVSSETIGPWSESYLTGADLEMQREAILSILQPLQSMGSL